MNDEYKLSHIVIKPTFACTANCATCGTRKILHKTLQGARMLTIEEWRKVLSDAKELGVKRMDISGGEPTLFKDLDEIISIGKNNNWHVNINTNGSLITEEMAKRMVNIGLNSAYISLYSHDSKKHDTMRGRQGLWEKATRSIRILANLQNQNFTIKTQTLIDKINYKDFPELIKLNFELGVSEMAISYLEGDFNGSLLLNVEEIKEFREKIIPKCIDNIESLSKNSATKELARKALKNLFSNDILDEEWSKGIYRPERNNLPKCTRPNWFSIVLANGDVHPCNAVEYTHEPIMGNVFKKSLIKIWRGKEFNDFRNNTFDYCKYCPINLYTILPLK